MIDTLPNDYLELTFTPPVFKFANDLILNHWNVIARIQNTAGAGLINDLLIYASRYGTAHEDGTVLLDFKQYVWICESVGAKPFAKPTLYKKLTEFRDKNIFAKIEHNLIGKKGKQYFYELQHPKDFKLSKPTLIDDSTQKPIEQVEYRSLRTSQYYSEQKALVEKLINDDEQLLLIPENFTQGYSERLINNIMFACGRQNLRDKKSKIIKMNYRFQDEFVKIVTTTTTDSEIYSLEDQSTILGIITLIVHSNKEYDSMGKTIENSYLIDVAELCRVCGLKPVGSNRALIRNSIDRLYSTNANITSPKNSKFADFFGFSDFTHEGFRFTPDNFDFRILWSRDSISELDPASGARMPRYYRISLHPIIFKQLLDKNIWNTFVVPTELITERCKYVIQFYFFAARNIKKKRGVVRKFSIVSLHKQLCPSDTRLDNWTRSVLNDFKKYGEKNGLNWDKNSTITFPVYGYYVKFTRQPKGMLYLTFWYGSPSDSGDDQEPIEATAIPFDGDDSLCLVN